MLLFNLANKLAIVTYFAVVTFIFWIGNALSDGAAMTQLASYLMIIGFILVVATAFVRRSTRNVAYATDEQEARALAFKPEPGKAVIYVFRSSGAYRWQAYGVYLDLWPWAALGKDTFATIMVEPGVHTISSVCSKNGSREDYMLALHEGRVYYFEQYFTFGLGNPRHSIRPLPPEVARRRIAGCRLLASVNPVATRLDIASQSAWVWGEIKNGTH